jgi:hypothetical protein
MIESNKAPTRWEIVQDAFLDSYLEGGPEACQAMVYEFAILDALARSMTEATRTIKDERADDATDSFLLDSFAYAMTGDSVQAGTFYAYANGLNYRLQQANEIKG